jgi:uncharacterized protein (TIGR03084 family)
MLLDELVDDLAAEQAALAAVLRALPPEAWELPTHATGWAVRDQVAHLASTDEAAALAIVDPEGFVEAVQERRTGAEGDTPSFLDRGRALPPEGVFAWWEGAGAALLAAARGLEAGARLPWYGPAMSAASFITARLMETWSHGLDVVDVVGAERPDTDRLRHVARLGVLTLPYSYRARGLTPPAEPVWVELTAPSGARWTFGDESAADRVRGTATDFCRVVTQRRHVSDTDLVVEGPVAREWMTIAQAFAGPPGEGRRPGQFPRAVLGG